MERVAHPLKMALEDLLAPGKHHFAQRAPARSLEGAVDLYVRNEKGETGRIAVEENGVRYFADLGQGQKTGWYYDQRDNRAFIAGLVKTNRCWTLIPIPAVSAFRRPRQARPK